MDLINNNNNNNDNNNINDNNNKHKNNNDDDDDPKIKPHNYHWPTPEFFSLRQPMHSLSALTSFEEKEENNLSACMVPLFIERK